MLNLPSPRCAERAAENKQSCIQSNKCESRCRYQMQKTGWVNARNVVVVKTRDVWLKQPANGRHA